MFHRPKRCVAFGMTTAGRPVMVAPKAEAMKPEDMGMYVHTDHYDKAMELIERLQTAALKSKKPHEIFHFYVADEIDKFQRSLENGI
jgi:hypothetical protein